MPAIDYKNCIGWRAGKPALPAEVHRFRRPAASTHPSSTAFTPPTAFTLPPRSLCNRPAAEMPGEQATFQPPIRRPGVPVFERRAARRAGLSTRRNAASATRPLPARRPHRAVAPGGPRAAPCQTVPHVTRGHTAGPPAARKPQDCDGAHCAPYRNGFTSIGRTNRVQRLCARDDQ